MMGRKARKFVRWLLALAALALALIVAAIVFKNPLLKTVTCWNIKRNTGLPTQIGAVDLDLARSRLRITSFRIYNAPPFGTAVLVDIPEIYLREMGAARVAYFPGDIDRSFWEVLDPDHGRILANTVRWALNEPEIPPNTGNVMRLCAATGARLHLIGRLGFHLDDHSLRRAGLDYLDAVDCRQHATIPAVPC